jgi:hypothetical protein
MLHIKKSPACSRGFSVPFDDDASVCHFIA